MTKTINKNTDDSLFFSHVTHTYSTGQKKHWKVHKPNCVDSKDTKDKKKKKDKKDKKDKTRKKTTTTILYPGMPNGMELPEGMVLEKTDDGNE